MVSNEQRPMLRFLIIQTAASVVGLQCWQILFNNFAVEAAHLDGFQVGVIGSVREVPGFLALLAVFVMLASANGPVSQKAPPAQTAMATDPTLDRDWDPVRPGSLLAPMIIGGAAAGAAHLTRKGRGDSAEDDFQARNRAALEEGISRAFGKVERNETDNTRLTNNIVVQECLKVIDAKVKPLGYDFRHEAGATQDGAGGEDLPERALKDGKPGGGGGHSFPDVLFRDGDKIVAINSATESSPGKYIGREIRSFDKLVQNVGEWVAKIIGKKRADEDEEDFRARAKQVCNEAFDEFLQKELEKLQNEQNIKDMEPPSP